MNLDRAMSSLRKRKLEILCVGGALAVCFLFLAWMVIEKSYEVAAERQANCISALKKIEVAKKQWALKSNAAPNSTPSWDDIIRFDTDSQLRRAPICPDGGTYTIGKLADHPTCSLGMRGAASAHTFPK